jgi:hypothetical protein
MADGKSIFSDDWRECLEEHYKDVVRRDDQLTERTLVGVLHDVGFRDADLQRLKLAATMRAEDMQVDVVPELDLEALEGGETVHAGVDVPVAPETAPHEVELDPEDNFLPEEVTVVAENPEDEAEAGGEETPDEPDPDAPQQMSMF